MKILVVDQCDIFRKGIKIILEESYKLDAYGEAKDYPTLLEVIHTSKWDIIIMDIEYVDGDGLDILKYITGTNPTFSVLIFSSLPPELYVVRAFRSGASGFISKATACNTFLEAVKTVMEGKKYITDYVSEHLSKNVNKNFTSSVENLSDREFYVFKRIAEGNAVSDIARELSLSVKTISHYRKNILVKLGLKNNAGIMRYAFTNELVK
jgi:two-component system, NarL family, invasion response regulator UvrY